MTVETVKSASVTNLDASPRVPNTAGRGAQGYLWQVNDYALVPAAASVTSKFFMVRVPCDVVLKELIFTAGAMGAGKFDLGLWYSASETDGTPASLRGTVIDQDFFASDIDCAAAVVPTDVVGESGFYGLQERNMPLWQAVGLSVNPGGFFDIIAVVHTTAVTDGAAYIHADARFIW